MSFIETIIISSGKNVSAQELSSGIDTRKQKYTGVFILAYMALNKKVVLNT